MEKSLLLWQKEWEEETGKAAWMRTLIPQVAKWYRCKYRRTNYYFT